MSIKFEGFDDLDKLLGDLQKKAEDIGGEIELNELFDPNFMTTYTNFSFFDEFLKKSPFDIHSQEDFDNINENELDKYVKETTRFSSWEEMKGKAGEHYAAKKLGF